MTEFTVDISNLNPEERSALGGKLDEYYIAMEKALNVSVKPEEHFIRVRGEKAEFGKILLENMIEIIRRQKSLEKSDFDYALSMIKDGNTESVAGLLSETVVYTAMGKPIRPKTIGQREYLDAIKNNDVCFGVGPAGTGKTYLAMACAVRAFKNQEVNRIILTRPAVEAGESLGFLPGDLQMKVDPYLRPLYDALFEMLGVENYNKYVEKNMIEVAPLAYMRGRTLDSAFVILDEAQNTTNEQMKMFLTRLGYGSKAIITGDITQTDLPSTKKSGLKTVLRILKNVNGVGIKYLSNKDIVRHPLVQRILAAYDRYEKRS
ncbi:PhoH family protein [Peptoniphilus equinus]|uniref:PhoH-like protein n=1 Tax=Peptoniphilus equinus TaxID=3016343 RepID=A0ABY7QUB5_9FIRM|nr:PhoH family protein [Peptoniphilus equinus]WBW50375.1 PhoH family protein [Peptoniphilus equinus]